MVRLDESDAEYRRIFSLFHERSMGHKAHYDFVLSVAGIQRVQASARLVQYEADANELGRIDPARWRGKEEPFHGTCCKNIHKIVSEGFSIREKPGMFGKGVYVAPCPLKCEQHAMNRGELGAYAGHFLRQLAGPVACAGAYCGAALGLAASPLEDMECCMGAGKTQKILLCDVYLGKQKRMDKANKNGHGQSEYDSGWAPGGSAVRVTECVVYKPFQVIPRYVFQVRKKEEVSPVLKKRCVAPLASRRLPSEARHLHFCDAQFEYFCPGYSIAFHNFSWTVHLHRLYNIFFGCRRCLCAAVQSA